MRIITLFQAKFAIRGGGHNRNVGWSSIGSYGVLIDMYKLNQISLSSDKSVVTMGPGNRWGEVYSYLVGSGVSTIGGRVPEVGVSGLTLGGKMYPRETTEYRAHYGMGCLD